MMDKMEERVSARIYFPRHPDENPYYTSNDQLARCAALARELMAAGVLVDRFQGGHRSGLKDACQLTVSGADTQQLEAAAQKWGCCYEIL